MFVRKMFAKVISVKILVLLIHIKITFSDKSKLVMNGELSIITDFPHSAFLSFECDKINRAGFFGCGGSILNQDIILTAAHCMFECRTYSFSAATFGHEENDKGILIDAFSFKLHKDYGEGSVSNDIALVLLKKSLQFSERVRRVILPRKPPEVSAAMVAGWGIDGNSDDSTLRHSQQRVLPFETCLFILSIPDGTLCAETVSKSRVPSNADSGSALIVHKHIQIGLISYKNPYMSKTITVYTNISYFYKWIMENSMKLYCNRQLNVTNEYLRIAQ